MFLRSSNESYAKGVLSDANYEYGKKRSLVSMKICSISWFIELVCLILMLISVLSTFGQLGSNDSRHTYVNYPDCICMFVIIPLVHLLNNEETKGVIATESWYQGLRHMLGIHNLNLLNQRANR